MPGRCSGADGGGELGLVAGDGSDHGDHRPLAGGQVLGHRRREFVMSGGHVHATVTGVPGSTIRVVTWGARRASASV